MNNESTQIQNSNQETDSTQIWNRILTAVLKMPGVQVDRLAFLRKALKEYAGEQKLDTLANVRPYAIVGDKAIDSAAQQCINRHTALATTGSTIAGLPGGLAMAATLPGDLVQYYFHVVVLSQKLAYLYGFPDLSDDSGKLSTEATNLLTLFLGSMMGVSVADQGISQLAQGLATSAVSRLPRVALTKAAVYPIAKQVARLIGMKLSHKGLAKTVGRLLPIAGGVFSGTVTLFTFRPGALRLQKRLKAQKKHFADAHVDAIDYADIRATFARAEHSERHPEDAQLAILQTMVNMANVSEDLSPEMQDFIEERIAQANLSDEQQLSLLEHLGTEYSIDVDYDLLACDPELAHEALRQLIAVMRVAGRQSVAEQMYLTMTAKAIGISKEELEELQNEQTKE